MFLVKLCIFFIMALGSVCLPIEETVTTIFPFRTQESIEKIILMPNLTEYESYMNQQGKNYTFLSSLPILIKETGEVCSNDRDAKKQYCVRLRSAVETFQLEAGKPLTACLDSRYGEGGSTSKQFSVEVGTSSSITPAIAVNMYTIFGYSGGVSASKSISFSMSNSCDVTKGKIVQMWGYPFFSSANAQYRSFKIGRSGRQKKWSDWSESQKVTLAANIPPFTKCVGSVDEASCGRQPVVKKFIIPGQPFGDDI